MATIDKLDISVNNYYAQNTEMVAQLKQQLSIDQAASIPPQIQILDISPKLAEIDLLLGLVPFYTPWAYFGPPKQFQNIRRSPFAFYRVAPSLKGYEEENEKKGLLEEVVCETKEEMEEKIALGAAFGIIKKINSWVSHIVGQMGRFVQG